MVMGPTKRESRPAVEIFYQGNGILTLRENCHFLAILGLVDLTDCLIVLHKTSSL